MPKPETRGPRKRESLTPAESLDELRAFFRTALADAVPSWLPRHAWWIQTACSAALLGFATYLIWIGEHFTAAMLAGLVVYVALRGIRKRHG